MEIASKYNPAEVEGKWYQYWLDNQLFKSEPDEREPYTIVIPPPNVTGVLHMGHMLNNTIQDILVRRARMQGKNACWVPGTDHASIATEAKVVGKLAEKGISKNDLTREAFLEHAWEWKEEHGGIILQQLRRLGASCDWDRTAFTMDEVRSESVIKVFTDLYNKGLIYRGIRMVNWDPQALTAVSDEEVIYKEEHSKLYYLKYKICTEDSPLNSPQGGAKETGVVDYIVIATTRPETILGDTAVCVNPNDPRYTSLKGKRVIVPLVNRSIPVIMDDYVDMEFGTGGLKVTPAHDVNDYALGEKYNLPSIDIFNDNGTINEAGELYIGMDRFDVRKQITLDLEAAGLLEKVEDYDNKVGYSERTHVPIEPKLSMQWFLKMEEMAKPALEVVMNDELKFYPPKFKNTYRHWMENIKDWCISRQLWWGHRIPAYYIKTSEGKYLGYVVAESEEKAREIALEKHPSLGGDGGGFTLSQDEDCLDTWFSSWLWPISLFDGINNPGNEEMKYYYPTNDLVTGPDIIFFWVARMIMAGYEYEKEMPFKNVYFTGLVRDKQGRKMSKSLGNSPDPLGLIDTYGADGVRMGLMLTAPAGNDIPFDESLCEQGRNFNNKIWNAFRLVKGWKVDEAIAQPEAAASAVKWFEMQLNKTASEMDDLLDKYRLSEALMTVYKLFWDEFSAWYLEMVKPGFEQPIDKATYEATLSFFDSLLRLLHPFMPFITEELWQALAPRQAGESIMMAAMPKGDEVDNNYLMAFEAVKEIVSGVRTIRLQKNIPNKETLELQVLGNHNEALDPVISKMCNLSAINKATEKAAGAVSFLVGTTEYAVPLGNLMNVEEELAKLNEELIYQEGFLASVIKKLSNESFVGKAPAKVIEMERKKQADAESKIQSLKDSIAALSK
ncbi:valyl-tRNA synthetase [Parabacteroides sp. PFB2-10]|uniref:valine--tRNA ligase n=1 Tax=Parabacteroides sp. PFB2-10 TaxID=1742405 RepID=UPI0024770D20|nr:valine--tRNA ligase [Parabacteroides sp. PFB2-10]MDH6312191.1 valyl-tRNA synthetase [Parabacteroides sp. PFB2-10]MDL2244515.1 valine--tRNA ligase [Parabacteroides sp. OttesenSCG-928-J18]